MKQMQFAVAVALVVGLGVSALGRFARADLPSKLSDQEFWTMVQDFSEPNGFFRSDNLVSNEDTFQYVIPELQKTVRPGGVYVGVGPDQNFTYIVALRPRMVFITDVRRGNLHLHLMYKALLELSVDRADFLSRLFSRRRPPGLGPSSTPEQLFAGYSIVAPTRELYDETLQAMLETLRKRHGFAIDEEDAAGIAYVFGSFYGGGPYLSYAMGGGARGRYPTYQDLQMATDGQGVGRAYLATEENFRLLRTMEQSNLIVPLVGNFAGPKALRAIGAYVKAHGGAVTTFYSSNVEQYLFQDRLWPDFARNLAALPVDETSTFIRSCFNTCMSYGARSVTLLDSMAGLLKDFEAGRIGSYSDVLQRRRSGR